MTVEVDLGSEALVAFADLVADRVTQRLLDHRDDDGWLNAREASAYLGVSVDALHKRTAARTIPFSQGGPGCKLFFRRSELDRWRNQRG